MALTDTIESERCFYKVRCEAAHSLTKVANQMVASWSGPPAMLNIFRKFFGSFSAPHIIKLNNFSNFQLYFLQKAIPVAMAGIVINSTLFSYTNHRFYFLCRPAHLPWYLPDGSDALSLRSLQVQRELAKPLHRCLLQSRLGRGTRRNLNACGFRGHSRYADHHRQSFHGCQVCLFDTQLILFNNQSPLSGWCSTK